MRSEQEEVVGAVEEVNGGDNLRLLLLAVVLVSWACAEGVAPTRQFDNAADANLARPDAQTVALTPHHAVLLSASAQKD